jgi:hypothetical protein
MTGADEDLFRNLPAGSARLVVTPGRADRLA